MVRSWLEARGLWAASQAMGVLSPTTLYDYGKICVHWFPQHMHLGMKKMRRIIQGYIPFSSASPLLNALIGGKERFVIFNKSDLADPHANKRLVDYAESVWPSSHFMLTSLTPDGLGPLLHRLAFSVRALPPAERHKVLIVGIPNVGKSTIINRLRTLGTRQGGKAVGTGDKPGVTKRVSNTIRLLEEPLTYMLDSPGILMPKIHSAHVGMRLAISGAISDAVLNDHILADYVFHTLCAHNSRTYMQHFGLSEPAQDTLGFIEAVSRAQGWREVNVHNAVMKIMRAFRAGSLGRFTLDAIPTPRTEQRAPPGPVQSAARREHGKPHPH